MTDEPDLEAEEDKKEKHLGILECLYLWDGFVE